MGRAEKNLMKIKAGQTAGWRFDQLKSILEWADFNLRPKGRGSHRVFKHEDSGARVVLPDHGSGTILPVYVEKLLAGVLQARGEI